MKQFNLEEYLKNPDRKLITRNGREARIICTDRKSITNAPILALVKDSQNNEISHTYYSNGMNLAICEHDNDLFFAPVKHEGWLNVYKDGDWYFFGADFPYATEKEAKTHIDCSKYKYVGTIKAEWED